MSITLKRICRDRLDAALQTIELDPSDVRQFLGPIEDIVAAVRAGPAHALFSIDSAGGAVGFYVVHPDARDAACWWLGWFALDRRQQGLGYGRATMGEIMAGFRRIPSCRRVRLLVAPDNAAAMRLYDRAGFRPTGGRLGGEIVLEARLTDPFTAGLLPAERIHIVIPQRHLNHPGRLRLSAGPYAARMIGVVRGPPGIVARNPVMRRRNAGPRGLVLGKRRQILEGRRSA